jgi:hypothetical protein
MFLEGSADLDIPLLSLDGLDGAYKQGEMDHSDPW